MTRRRTYTGSRIRLGRRNQGDTSSLVRPHDRVYPRLPVILVAPPMKCSKVEVTSSLFTTIVVAFSSATPPLSWLWRSAALPVLNVWAPRRLSIFPRVFNARVLLLLVRRMIQMVRMIQMIQMRIFSHPCVPPIWATKLTCYRIINRPGSARLWSS